MLGAGVWMLDVILCWMLGAGLFAVLAVNCCSGGWRDGGGSAVACMSWG